MAKGYQNYRGRRSAAIKLLIILLALILLAACAFIVVQRFVTYTDDGTVRLDLPGFSEGIILREGNPENMGKPSNPAPNPNSNENEQNGADINLIIGDPSEADSQNGENGENGTNTPPENQTQTPVTAPLERRLMQINLLPDAEKLTETLAASNANGFLWRARENTGVVRFGSTVCIQDAVAKNAVSSETLTALCATEGVVSAALFNCFHDSYYAFVNMESAAICQSSGFVWYDNLSYHWLDPAKEQARKYVINLAVECAEMGFDELVLEDMAYPVNGKLQKINYSKNAIGKTEALVLFLTELRAVLESYNVKLGLLLTEDIIASGGDETSGQDLTQLLPLVDTVYARVSDVAGAQAALDASSGSVVLVSLTKEPGEGQWCVAAE